MKIAVYLGSTLGNDPAFEETARAVGTWIGRHGHTLVYGGAGVGTMKVLAEAAHENGAYVIGVMPEFMIEAGKNADFLDELHTTKTMEERRTQMIALSDAYMALPGGPGTLDEISEVISDRKLGLVEGDIILFSVNGYYDALEEMLQHMTKSGFYPEEYAEKVMFVHTMEELENIFEGAL